MATIVFLIVVIGTLGLLAWAVRSLMAPNQEQEQTTAASDRFSTTTH